ncbi:hypothetical protein [Amycolatopsis sp. NPDC051903]|uniref:hypothetical protein n=1 Tax=Amycolatopsis sp. NPDC051903 TaxID=3363936 RepID=UPI0037BC2D0F
MTNTHSAPNPTDADVHDIVDLHQVGLTFHQTRPLRQDGITTVELLAELLDAHDAHPQGSRLSAVPQFGPGRVAKVRAALDAWKAARE